MIENIWLYLLLGLLALVVLGLSLVAVGRRRGGAPAAPEREQEAPPARPPEAEPEGAEPTGGGTDVDTAPPTATGTVEPEATVAEPAQPVLDRPEAAGSRMARLRSRLARSGTLGSTLLNLLSKDSLTEADWEEIEETLLLADVGAGPTDDLMAALRTRARVDAAQEPEQVRAILRAELLNIVDPEMDRSLSIDAGLGDDGEPHPATILVVGVNGTGKTTTIGKLARLLVAEDRDVYLGAADTFRAAAAEQLTTWGDRVGVPVIRSDREGADPASVAFDAVRAGREAGADVVMIDTAGRLQNKSGLMDELGKIKRVVSRSAPVAEVLLVLDATTGQNGMRQAQVFAEVVDVTGIVLTKLDGTAKGGIVVAVQRELGVPVKLVGLGEGPDDLAPFDAEEFVDALLT
ncbi:signal recognition particle-docking protein FtsY [Pseudactinotalea sp. Z1739]|uniref:signal recognition particle-docking protein FtsY n=1 Tax=Pseudactinotalea sp. Z1739 TaxID=3413028 RepID=UPI003C7CAAEA